MYILKNIYYQILRNKLRSLITICISVALLCSMLVYLGSLVQSEENMDNLAVATPVTGEVTSPNGYHTQNLSISSLVFSRITSMDISNIKYTILLSGTTEKDTDNIYPDMMILAGNCFDKSYNIDTNFSNSTEAICLIDEKYLTEQELQIGDYIDFTLFYRDYDMVKYYWSFTQMNSSSLKIVGTFDTSVLSREIDLIVPIDWIENEILTFGEDLFYDSFSFTVTDPSNLNEFKEELSSKSMSPVSSDATNSYIGRSIRLDDKLYIENAELFMQTIDTLETFLIAFFVIIIILIMLISFLLGRSERKNIAIACSLGASKPKVSIAYFLSNLLLNIISSLIVIPICLLFTSLSVSQIFLIIALYIACFAVGSAITLKATLSFDLLKMLLG